MSVILYASGVLVVTVSLLTASGPAQAAEVNVYSYRQPFLMKPLFTAFTRATGIKVNVVFGKKGLIQRAKSEDRNSSADIILTSDIGRLREAVDAGIAAPVRSAVLAANIPAHLRDPAGRWLARAPRRGG